MKFIGMSDFCKKAGMATGKTEETVERLISLGVQPMAHIVGEREGKPFDRPLYVEEQLAIVEATRAHRRSGQHAPDDRLTVMEKQLNKLMAALGENDGT
jgi:hypothetical protein